MRVSSGSGDPCSQEMFSESLRKGLGGSCPLLPTDVFRKLSAGPYKPWCRQGRGLASAFQAVSKPVQAASKHRASLVQAGSFSVQATKWPIAPVQVFLRFSVLKCPPKYPYYNIKRAECFEEAMFLDVWFQRTLSFRILPRSGLELYRGLVEGLGPGASSEPPRASQGALEKPLPARRVAVIPTWGKWGPPWRHPHSPCGSWCLFAWPLGQPPSNVNKQPAPA